MRWRKVAESGHRVYFVSAEGDVMSKAKGNGREIIMSPYLAHNGFAYVKVGSKEERVKKLVAMAWLEDWTPDCLILNEDGDPFNNRADNLVCVSRTYCGQVFGGTTRKAKAVVVEEKGQEPIVYPSVRLAAKDLNCSNQTIIDYLEGRWKKSCLAKEGRTIRYAD